VTIWSGNLYRLAAVQRVGLPNPGYFMDWGEYEYGYRVKKAGYKAFVCQDAVINHNIAGIQSLTPRTIKIGPFTVTFYDNPASRCYYLCRNTVYFTLYDYESKRFGLLRPAVWRIRSAPGRPGLMRGLAWQLLFFITNFMVRPRTHGPHVAACLRGIWHGLTRNMAARY
jgi:GT2 family glycosyltransferase